MDDDLNAAKELKKALLLREELADAKMKAIEIDKWIVGNEKKRELEAIKEAPLP